MKLTAIILLFLALKVNAEKFYVSTNGNSGNSGSLASPWNLTTAFSHAVNPGDTIYVLAGTYTGQFVSSLTGTALAPIKVIAQGRVIIDGSLAGQAIKNITTLIINGAYTWYIGLEVTNSDPQRIVSTNPSEERGSGVVVNGVGVKVINCIIYDTGQGISAWTPSTNSEFYGNIIFNNGWDAPDRLHGHGIYSQNQTGTKLFKENIILNNFGYGFHIYTEGGSIKNFYFEGNVEFNDNWLMGGYTPLQNIELNTNFSYKDKPVIGYSSRDNDGLNLTNNYFASSMNLLWWKNVTATGNTIFNYNTIDEPIFMQFDQPASPPDLSTWHFNNNTYYWAAPAPPTTMFFTWINNFFAPGSPGGEGFFSLSQWQSAGQDQSVSIEYYPKVGGSNIALYGKKTFVRPNAYDSKRSHIIIYNWDLSNAVNVNVAGILSTGDTYELRNVQNYFGDVITGTFLGGDSLSIPMTGHTVALPLGYSTAMGANTFPEFGTFVLVKTSSPVIPGNLDSLYGVIATMQGQIAALQDSLGNYDIRVRTDETLLNTTADQPLFTNPAHDSIKVQANTTYDFDITFDLTHLSVPHNLEFGMKPINATITSITYDAEGWTTAVGINTASQNTVRIKNTTTVQVIFSGNNATETIHASGWFTVGSTGGYIRPSIQFSANPTGTVLLKSGARFLMKARGNDTYTQKGQIQ